MQRRRAAPAPASACSRGTYRSTSPQGFRVTPTATATGNLSISGGWSLDCQARAPGSRSTIDGELLRPGLVLLDSSTSGGLLLVASLSIINGFSPGEQIAGGLTANPFVATDLDIEVEDNYFANNVADNQQQGFGGGLKSVADGTLLIRNNVFLRNHAERDGGAASLTCCGGLSAFVNNTVYANSADIGAPGDNGGVSLNGFGNCVWEVANNSLWGNEGLDLMLFTDDAILRYNNLDDLGGPEPPSSSTNNVDVDPQFFSPGILRLQRSSPMIDAGLNEPLTGLPVHAIDGAPRLIGPRVDIGAYEFDVLLANGFDAPFSIAP